jgi:hypothetical protein
MNTTIQKFTLFFTTCLLACSVQAQRGPQDTWYETGRVALPSGCSPFDIILTRENTLLLSDHGNDKIQELDKNGTFIKSYGSAGSNNLQFNNPTEIAIGPNNRIYITDTNNHRIQVIDRNGSFIKSFGTNGTNDGEFNNPWGICISLDNEIYITDQSNHRVQVFDLNGTFRRKWGELGDLDGKLKFPKGIDVDDSGQVYIMDSTNKRICIYSKAGNFLSKINVDRGGNSSFVWPYFLKIFSNGLIATGGENTNYNQHLLRLREKNGNLLRTLNFDPPFYAKGSPSAMGADGKIFFANQDNKKLYILTQTYRSLRSNSSKDAPLPEVISVTQPAGTNHLEVKYRITDADSSKVKAGLLAFKDGGNDLSKVIVPQTFIGSVAGKLDENTTTGTIHTVIWDAKADWNVSYGNVELAVVAQDDRELMNFHFLTLPATDSNSTPLKISRSPVDQPDFLNAWYTLLALGDPGITLQNGRIKPVGSGEVFTSTSGLTTNYLGRPYLLDKMNLREATSSEIDRAREAATPGVTNKFTPSFQVGPGERPVKVNEYGFDSDSTSSSHYWVVPKN